MELAIKKAATIQAKYLQVTVPIRFDEEDIPNDFPCRKADIWEIVIDLDNGFIEDWESIGDDEVFLKVSDSGKYRLLDESKNEIVSISDYVPECLMIEDDDPDYISINIREDGYIKGWDAQHKDLVNFFFADK